MFKSARNDVGTSRVSSGKAAVSTRGVTWQGALTQTGKKPGAGLGQLGEGYTLALV